VRLAPALQRDAALDALNLRLQLFRRFAGAAHARPRRGDGAGSHVVNRDAVRGQLEGHRLGHHHDRALRGVVVDEVAGWPEGVDRGDVDDAPAAPLLDHLPGCSLRVQVDAHDVDVEHLADHGRVGIEEGRRWEDAGVADQNVQPAEGVYGLLDAALHIFDFADIRLSRHNLPAKAFCVFRRLLGSFQVDVRNKNVRTGFRQPPDDARADAERAASYQGRLTREVK